MKKILSIGLFTAAILFTSCNFDFFNPTEPEIEQPADTPTDSTTKKTEENTTKKPDEQAADKTDEKPADKPADKTDEKPADEKPSDKKAEIPQPSTENYAPVAQSPFNTELCATSVNSITLSNGDWTCEVYNAIYGLKMTGKASVNNNQPSYTKGFAQIDLEAEEGEELPSTAEELKAAYDSIIEEYKKAAGENSPFNSFTYSKVYIPSANRRVFISDIKTEALAGIFNFSNVNDKTIKINSNNNKYVITDQTGVQTIYIYKDANLSDAEEVPQNDQTNPENQNEPAAQEPEPQTPEATPQTPAEGSGDTEDLGYTAPALEKSDGTDSLAGKSFGDEKYQYFFRNDGTASIKQYIKQKGAETGDFYPYAEIEYAFDAASKFLKYRWIKGTMGFGSEVLTYKEMIASITAMYKQELPEDASESDIDAMVSMSSLYIKEIFETLTVAKAEIINGKLSLQNDYFTEVPDIKNIFLQGIASEKVNGSAVTIELYGESRAAISESLGSISIEMPHEGGTHVKQFDITEITADTIKVSGENKISWEDVETYNLSQTLIFTYSVVCNSDGRLTFTISGNDDVTKAELGATEDNPNPSYELRSAGASILEPITE